MSAGRGAESALLALGLVVAFSPTWIDWARHAVDTPWSRYALVFPVLFAVAARRERGAPEAAPRAGLLYMAAGLAAELGAAFAGAIRWARPGLALAAFGWCRRTGLARPRTAALLLFAVPAPAFAIHAGSGALLRGWWAPVTAAWSALGSALPEGVGPGALGDRGALALAPLLAGVAWYDGCLQQRRLLPAALISAGCALAALPLAGLLLFAAAGAWTAGADPRQAGLVLRWAWLPVAATAIAWAEWRWRRREVRA